jgi:hypothetical protein
MKDSRLAVIGLFFALAACSGESDKDTQSVGAQGTGGSGTTDNTPGSSTLSHESGFSLTTDDAASRLAITATASYAADVSADGVNGFVAYTETDASGSETCSTVLSLRTVFPEPDPHTDTASPSPADALPCSDCDYGHFVQTDASSITGSCTFPSSLVGLDQVAGFDHGFTDLVFAVYDGGTTLKVMVNSDPPVEIPLFEAGTATFGGGTLQGTNTETAEVVDFWDGSCTDDGAFAQYFTMIPGELALSDSLACPAGVAEGTTVYDTWERVVEHGYSMTTAIRAADQSLFIYLVAPNECLAQTGTLAQSCDGAGSAYCQSIELLAQEGGPYVAVIEGPCTTTGVIYEFDARVF